MQITLHFLSVTALDGLTTVIYIAGFACFLAFALSIGRLIYAFRNTPISNLFKLSSTILSAFAILLCLGGLYISVSTGDMIGAAIGFLFGIPLLLNTVALVKEAKNKTAK